MSELRPAPSIAATRHGVARISLATARCVIRGLPRFFGAAPKTPLRTLGIIALDSLRVLHLSQPLSRKTALDLAMFLDFLGCANAVWDHKRLRHTDYQAMKDRLERAGLGVHLQAYLERLRDFESRRPRIGGDRRRFDEVRAYREAVARLSVTTVAAIALDLDGSPSAFDMLQNDANVDTLVRILLQCQIIDDVFDYTEDRAAELPSFLTATASSSQAIELTAAAARSYGARDRSLVGRTIFPFRLTLVMFTVATGLIVRAAARLHRRDANLEEMCRRVGT